MPIALANETGLLVALVYVHFSLSLSFFLSLSVIIQLTMWVSVGSMGVSVGSTTVAVIWSKTGISTELLVGEQTHRI